MLFEIMMNVNNFILGAVGGESIATGIRDFIGPILMLVMGIVAITFLFKREMTQFIIFISIAIVVAAIFYGPDLIKEIGNTANQGMGGKGW